MALKMRSTGGSMDVPEAGTFLGRLVAIVDLDLQPGFEWDGEEVEPQYKVTFTYELPSSRTKEDKPHWVSEDFKVSDHERSKMFARVKALDPTGRLSSKGSDLAGLINAPCMVEVSLNKKGYPKIENVTGAPASIPVPELENDPYTFDWDTPNMEVYRRMPDFVKNKLKASLNYEGSPLHREIMMSGEDDDNI